ncbi:MAG: ABC transporter permease, partial [Clostridia bacterium]|nr:ABC transporter permease [Clostridia bacterium]
QAIISLIQTIIMVAIFLIFGVYMPYKSVITGSFLVDLSITIFLITYAADMLGLMISCIVHTPMTAMTVMPFVLIVQLVFANFVIPLNAFGQKVSNITISKWGIQAICAVSDYNSQESTVLLTALNTMNNRDPESLVSRIQRVLSIDEVNHKVGQLTAAQLQKANYAFTTENVLKNWGILLGFTLLYVVIGLIFLEQVDHDKR